MIKQLFCIFIFSNFLFSHFQVILPASDYIDYKNRDHFSLDLFFAHPFEKLYMNMQEPYEFGIYSDGKIQDLKKDLTTKLFDGKKGFTIKYVQQNPQTNIFFVKPKPYFEKSEQKFITHLTKVVVDAFGYDDGWDKNIGLKAEIIPLVKPYGLYVGNTFRAKVLYKNKKAAGVNVEIEYLAQTQISSPTPYHITQVIKTDENGVFTFSVPKSGWWGFSALIDDDEKIIKDQKKYPQELGAVFWAKFYDFGK